MARTARIGFFVLSALLSFGCSDLRDGQADPAGAQQPSATTTDGGTPLLPVEPGGLKVTVESIANERTRLGASSGAGFRPWRTGIATSGDRVYWVEAGSAPGVYSAPIAGCADAKACAEKLVPLTRAASFVAISKAMYVADTNALKRVGYDGVVNPVASASADIVNVATDDARAFWTFGTDQDLRATPIGTASSSSVIVHSNGTPVGMAVAGTKLFWVGVDISGQVAAIQSIGTDGKGGREVSRFTGGFSAMGGNAQYLYFAEGSPAKVHRLTLSTGRDVVVARDALGVTDFALDDAYAYWSEPGDSPDFENGRIRRVAHEATEAVTLAEAVVRPVAVAVSGKNVLVAAAGTKASGYTNGKILRMHLE